MHREWPTLHLHDWGWALLVCIADAVIHAGRDVVARRNWSPATLCWGVQWPHRSNIPRMSFGIRNTASSHSFPWWPIFALSWPDSMFYPSHGWTPFCFSQVLFEQFRFFLNFYFLLMAISQFVPEIRVGYLYTYWGPLVSFLTHERIHISSSQFTVQHTVPCLY